MEAGLPDAVPAGVPAVSRPEVCTVRDAEDLLLEAMEYLAAMPDRERGYLRAGQRSAWPSIVRDIQADYPKDAGPPRLRVGRKEAELVERMLTGEGAAVLAVPVEARTLLGRVLAGKLWGVPVKGERERFTWELLWEAEHRRCRARREKIGVTSNGLRMRYERALGKVAAAVGTV